MQQTYTLSQLSAIIKEVLNISLSDYFWIKAEISELHENRNGNCYLELIEKDAYTDRILAKFRALIWSNVYRILKPYFEQNTQAEFKAGISVLVKVKVEFSDLYGISLVIHDIDPSFTLGDFELRRAQILQQLMSEGVYEMNKQLSFALVPQRIAVISSETAAGYQDFVNHLQNNEYGFKYEVTLFKAYMQGDEAEPSIIQALDKISEQDFDVLVITRGGGSRSDLAAFDRYMLALHVCQFPIPIISAIGHERDVSIIDMVAHTRVKTPTAAAHFIIEKTLQFWTNVADIYENIIFNAKSLLDNELKNIEQYTLGLKNSKYVVNEQEYQLKETVTNIIKQTQVKFIESSNKISNYANSLSFKVHKRLQLENTAIDSIYSNIVNSTQYLLQQTTQHLSYAEKLIQAVHPEKVLRKGYSITRKNGKAIKTASEVKSGDEITTVLYQGEINSYVK